MDYAKIGPFKILDKTSEVNYRLDLLERIKIYPVQYIAMLEPAHGETEPLVYKQDIYKGRKEDKWPVKAIINYKDINDTI